MTMSNVKKTFLFFLGLGLIHVALTSVARKAGDVYKLGVYQVIENKRQWATSVHPFDRTKKSVVFIGNSVVLAGIMPTVFDETLAGKTDSYNFSLPALPIGAGMFILQSIVEHWGKPDYVVLQIFIDENRDATGLFDTNAVQGIGISEFLSYVIHRPNKAFALNYAFPLRMNIQNAVKYLTQLIKDRSALNETRTNNQEILKKLRDDRGWFYIRQQAYFPDGRLPEGFGTKKPADLTPREPTPFEWKIDPYLRKFFDYAAQQQIKILLIGPVRRVNSEPPLTRMPDEFLEIPKLYPNVRVSPKSWQQRFYSNYYFSDKTHLNADGAALWTREVAEDFKQAFGDELL